MCEQDQGGAGQDAQFAVLPHATIHQAQGILMALNHSDADAAWVAMQRVSEKFTISLLPLAEATIAIATSPQPAVNTHAAAAVHELLDPSLRIPQASSPTG